MPGGRTRTLASVMYNLPASRVVVQDRQPVALVPADQLAKEPTCRDCGAVFVPHQHPRGTLCELCYVNRLIHGRAGVHV